MLSRADAFGRGPLGGADPIEPATRHARSMAEPLSDHLHTVVPVAGLLAEAAHTGVLTEECARRLAELQGISPVGLLSPAEETAALLLRRAYAACERAGNTLT